MTLPPDYRIRTMAPTDYPAIRTICRIVPPRDTPSTRDDRRAGRRRTLGAVFFLTAAATIHASAQPLPQEPPPSWHRRATAIGVTRNDAPILVYRGLAGGGDDDQPRLVFVLSAEDAGRLTAAATGLIDGIVSGGDARRAAVAADVDLTRGFPPQAGFYDHPTQPESRYLWRWIGIEAPDLVVEVAAGPGETWFVPDSDLPQLRDLAGRLPGARPLAAGDGLVQRLVTERVAGVGAIPAVRVETDAPRFVATLDAALARIRLPESPARVERDHRLARSPKEIAEQLLDVYGRKLDSVQYIPALALVGRLRQHALDHGAGASPPPIVLEATAPYVDGTRPSTGGPGGGSVYPGHLIFGELARTTGDRRYVELVLAAADAAFDDAGAPREAMPQHNEMSDAVFMGCPILAQAAGLTADEKYADACLRNLRFIQTLCLRNDGLYRHSPLDEAAWGRGNGFPALGLCWSLDELPETSPVREEIATAHRAHLTALLPHQDATGCWHQVIDHPESYREFTATAMITYAIMRGIRAGRLDAATFGPAADRAWRAVAARIAADGSLVDVCTGTGKQKTLRDYYDRPAILGRDDRGGAMALLVATERQRYALPNAAGSPQQR